MTTFQQHSTLCSLRATSCRRFPIRPLALIIASLAASCVLPSEHAKLVDEVAELKGRMTETEHEARIAITNASCSNEVIDLMKVVAALCTKELLCTESEILSAISEADAGGRFLFLMHTQRSAAFYFPNPWNNKIQAHRLSKLLEKRELPRTKLLIVSNSTPRKTNQAHPGEDPAVNLASERAKIVIDHIKLVSERMHIADPRILPVQDQDMRVWIVPYLVEDADLARLGPNDLPPIGYYNIAPSKQKPAQQAQLKQAVLQSVFVYLIDCWPADPPAAAAAAQPPAASPQPATDKPADPKP